MRLFLFLILLILVIFLLYKQENFDINERAKKRLFGLSDNNEVPIGNKEVKIPERALINYVPIVKSQRQNESTRQRLQIEKKINTLDSEETIAEYVEIMKDIDDVSELVIVNSDVIINNDTIELPRLEIKQSLNNYIQVNFENLTYSVNKLGNIIDGNLIINNVFGQVSKDGKDNIQFNDLYNKAINKFLIDIVEIRGNLIIVNNITIMDLFGVRNIKKIKGDLIIVNNQILNNICNFNINFNKIDGKINIYENKNLRKILKGLFNNTPSNEYKIYKNLTEIVDLKFIINEDDNEYFCEGYPRNFLNFQFTYNGVEFSGDRYLSFLENYEFGYEINGSLTLIDSNIDNNNYFNRYDYILDYEKSNTGCEIKGLNKLLNKTKIINGNVTIRNCANVTNLSAFENIEINGNIYIEDNDNLNDICGIRTSLQKDQLEQRTFKLTLTTADNLNTAQGTYENCSIRAHNVFNRFLDEGIKGRNWIIDTNARDPMYVNYIEFDIDCKRRNFIYLYNEGGDFNFYESSGNYFCDRYKDSILEKTYTLDELRSSYTFMSKDDEPFLGNINITGSWDIPNYNTLKYLLKFIPLLKGDIKIKDFTAGTSETLEKLDIFDDLVTINGNITLERVNNISKIHFSELNEVNNLSIILQSPSYIKDTGDEYGLNFNKLTKVNNLSLTNLQSSESEVDICTLAFNELDNVTNISIYNLYYVYFNKNDDSKFLSRTQQNSLSLTIGLDLNEGSFVNQVDFLSNKSDNYIFNQLCNMNNLTFVGDNMLTFTNNSSQRNLRRISYIPDCFMCETILSEFTSTRTNIELESNIEFSFDRNRITSVKPELNMSIDEFICNYNVINLESTRFEVRFFRITDVYIFKRLFEFLYANNNIINSVVIVEANNLILDNFQLQNKKINKLKIAQSRDISCYDSFNIKIKELVLINVNRTNRNFLKNITSNNDSFFEILAISQIGPQARTNIHFPISLNNKLQLINYIRTNIPAVANNFNIILLDTCDFGIVIDTNLYANNSNYETTDKMVRLDRMTNSANENYIIDKLRNNSFKKLIFKTFYSNIITLPRESIEFNFSTPSWIEYINFKLPNPDSNSSICNNDITEPVFNSLNTYTCIYNNLKFKDNVMSVILRVRDKNNSIVNKEVIFNNQNYLITRRFIRSPGNWQIENSTLVGFTRNFYAKIRGRLSNINLNIKNSEINFFNALVLVTSLTIHLEGSMSERTIDCLKNEDYVIYDLYKSLMGIKIDLSSSIDFIAPPDYDESKTNYVILPNFITNEDGDFNETLRNTYNSQEFITTTDGTQFTILKNDTNDNRPSEPNYFKGGSCQNDVDAIEMCQSSMNAENQYYCENNQIKQSQRSSGVPNNLYGLYNGQYLRNIFINHLDQESCDAVGENRGPFTLSNEVLNGQEILLSSDDAEPNRRLINTGADNSPIYYAEDFTVGGSDIPELRWEGTDEPKLTGNIIPLRDHSGNLYCNDPTNTIVPFRCPPETNYCRMPTDEEISLRNFDDLKSNYICADTGDTCGPYVPIVTINITDNINLYPYFDIPSKQIGTTETLNNVRIENSDSTRGDLRVSNFFNNLSVSTTNMTRKISVLNVKIDNMRFIIPLFEKFKIVEINNSELSLNLPFRATYITSIILKSESSVDISSPRSKTLNVRLEGNSELITTDNIMINLYLHQDYTQNHKIINVYQFTNNILNLSDPTDYNNLELINNITYTGSQEPFRLPNLKIKNEPDVNYCLFNMNNKRIIIENLNLQNNLIFSNLNSDNLLFENLTITRKFYISFSPPDIIDESLYVESLDLPRTFRNNIIYNLQNSQNNFNVNNNFVPNNDYAYINLINKNTTTITLNISNIQKSNIYIALKGTNVNFNIFFQSIISGTRIPTVTIEAIDIEPNLRISFNSLFNQKINLKFKGTFETILGNFNNTRSDSCEFRYVNNIDTSNLTLNTGVVNSYDITSNYTYTVGPPNENNRCNVILNINNYDIMQSNRNNTSGLIQFIDGRFLYFINFIDVINNEYDNIRLRRMGESSLCYNLNANIHRNFEHANNDSYNLTKFKFVGNESNTLNINVASGTPRINNRFRINFYFFKPNYNFYRLVLKCRKTDVFNRRISTYYNLNLNESTMMTRNGRKNIFHIFNQNWLSPNLRNLNLTLVKELKFHLILRVRTGAQTYRDLFFSPQPLTINYSYPSRSSPESTTSSPVSTTSSPVSTTSSPASTTSSPVSTTSPMSTSSKLTTEFPVTTTTEK